MNYLLSLFCLMGATLAELIPSDYVQVYSNYYVQSTTEIDWKCIRVSVTQDQDRLNVTKNGYLHGIYGSPVKSIMSYNVTGKNKFKGEKETLVLRVENEDYLLWTGTNNLTMYVWAKDYERFMDDHNDDVRDYLKTLNFTGMYKTPVFSFTSACIRI